MAHFSPLLHLTSARPWLLAVLLLLAPAAGRAQAPGWGGAVVGSSSQTTGNSQTNAVATDASGNVFVTGFFTGTVVFGSSTLTSAGGYDLFVAKYVPATGTWAWAQRGGGTGDDFATDVAVSGTSVYVAGSYNNNAANARFVLLGTTSVRGVSSTLSQDLLLAKYTDAGSSATVAWVQVGGGGAYDSSEGVAASGSSVYVTGYVNNTTANSQGALLGGNGTSPGTLPLRGASPTVSPDVVLAKYTDNGATATLGWAQVGGGTGEDQGLSVAVSGTSVYVAGYLTNTRTNSSAVVFGGNGTTAGTVQVNGASTTSGPDLLLAKYTDQGSTATLAWTQVGGGTGDEQGNSVAVSGSSVYVTGTLYNSSANVNAVVFGGGGTTPGTTQVNGASATTSQDLVLAKYTDNGSSAALGWTQVGGGTGTELGWGVATSGPSVYVAGVIINNAANANAVVFGGGGTTPGTVPVKGTSGNSSYDVVLAKYTDTGATATVAWAQVGGGTGSDYGYSVALSGQRVYVGGVATPPATFGPTTLATPSGYDLQLLAYLTDLSLTPLGTQPAAPADAAALTLYPNPAPHGAATLTGTPPGTTVQVLDALGRLVAATRADATGTAPLTGLPAGLYVVRAGTGAVRLSVE